MLMNTEKKYHIIFVNKLIKDVSFEEARKNLVETFQISEKSSARLFSLKTACLSKTNIEDNAIKAVEMIREIGFESKILVAKPKATSRISASAELPGTDVLNITRHIDSLKPRAQRLKEKISLFTGDAETGHGYRRGSQPPVPEPIDEFVNIDQIATIEAMKHFGWSLFFIRRADPQSTVTVMILPATGETARVETDGSFNRNHDVYLRH